MDLYFSPMSCALATRATLYECGAPARFVQVDAHTKRTLEGDDYWRINPMGQVPALRTDDGWLLTENPAVLQHVAASYPQACLLPEDLAGLSRVQQWLGFIGTELHKAVFVPLLDPKAGAEVKQYARDKLTLRMGLLQTHLQHQAHLVASYSVADIYLATVLNWAPYAGVDLAQWPAVQAYHQRQLQRPALARALSEEFALFQEEQTRRARAT
jgi:glutathione S-transferase